MMNKRMKITAAVLAAIALVFVLYHVITIPSVDTVTLKKEDTEITVVCNGTIQPKETINIIFNQAVVVDEVYVEEGDRVKKGDRLMTLSNTPKTNPYGQGQSVYATCDGIVSQLTAEKGNRYNEFKVLAVVSNTEQLYVLAQVSENNYNQIEVGQAAVADCSASDEKYACTVEKMYAAVERLSTVSQSNYLSILLSLDQPDDSLLPGFSSTVEISTSTFQDAITVPESAVFDQNGSSFVYTVDRMRTKKIPVEIAMHTQDGALIQNGLEEEAIVVFNADTVQEGQWIRREEVPY